MHCLCQGVLCTVCVRVSYALFVSGCLMHCLCQGVLLLLEVVEKP